MPSPREVILLVLLVCMEITAAFAVVVGSSLLDATSLQYAMYWLLLLSALVGLSVALLVGRIARAGEPWNRIALIAGAAVGAALPAAVSSHNAVSFVVALLLLLIAYWRGIAASQEPPSHDEVLRRFGIGFALLFLGLIWVVARGIDSHRSIWQMLAFLGIAFTILSFIALVIARIERTREPGSSQAIVLAVGVQLIFIFLLAVAALQIFSYDIVGAMMSHIQGFWDALGATLFRGVTLVASPIQWFINLLRPHGHPHQVQPTAINPPGTAEQFGRKPKSSPKGNPTVVIVALIILGLIFLALLYGIWRALPRLRRIQPDRGFTEERRSLTLAQMWAILVDWLQSVFSRGAAVTREAVRAGRRRVLGDLPEDPVRRAYVRVLRRAAAAGLRREEGATPGEFRARLVAAWPAGADDFSSLTAAYMRRRYGEVTSEPREIQRIGEQWQRLRLVMRAPRFQAKPAAAESVTESVEPEKGGRRWRMPDLRHAIRLPDPSFGMETPKFSRSIAVAVFSFLAPIVIIIGLLAFFAILSNEAARHHGMGHALPAAHAVPLPAHLRDNVLYSGK